MCIWKALLYEVPEKPGDICEGQIIIIIFYNLLWRAKCLVAAGSENKRS